MITLIQFRPFNDFNERIDNIDLADILYRVEFAPPPGKYDLGNNTVMLGG